MCRSSTFANLICTSRDDVASDSLNILDQPLRRNRSAKKFL